ncbi:hypothetical protein GLAREA_00281 [Glarea lozoyensis ATCC 20868]|uniref:Uncharacterized protein n=1 Tax=Glarea lozoyensis (strain ATCC 20868 / MF5171) TaxID=1116229 RepID=S3DRN3_GLAL2|nr:uncharacterized protein GLAREA_00281 [Glarea lozoyensis ATCC 20868]EPE29123.1 hypothetical protein GLAREA_00281 [Glarea lozoyensis ATCC 20868]
MCFGSKSKPRWEEDVVFASRPKKRHHHHQSHSTSRTQMTETIIKTQRAPSVEYVRQRSPSPPPRMLTPPPKPSPPPPAPVIIVPAAPSPPPRIELVSVEEDLYIPKPPRSHASTSRSSHTRHGSRGGEEVYIERERIRERAAPSPPREEYETFRYVPGVGPGRRERESVGYEGERTTRRVVERERVRGEEGRGSYDRRY